MNKRNRRALIWILAAAALYLLLLFLLVAAERNSPDATIRTMGDAFWYSLITLTTIGYGDLAAVTFPGRLTVVIVTFAGILTTAMVPGVVVAYYTEFIRAKEKETVSTFLEKLERLPELDREELTELSERVKRYVNGNKK